MNIIDFNEEEQKRFVDGWMSAGGFTGDLDAPNPWCCPWTYMDELEIPCDTPEEAGKIWKEKIHSEVEEVMTKEEIWNKIFDEEY